MRIADFQQTPFISHSNQNLVYVQVSDWDLCNPYQAQVTVAGEIICSKKVFAPAFSLMLPVFETETVCTVQIAPFEDTPIENNYVLKPQKHWQIMLLYSAHEDLGYCGYVEKLPKELYLALKKAMELCDRHPGFRYMIEHFWWLDSFDRYASEEEKEQLRRLIREKKIELNAIHSGTHTSWSNAEQLVREMYFSCFDAAEKYGAKPTCTIYSDISGISWPAVNVRAGMGIRYMGVLANSWRCGEENKSIPPFFWWKDQSGENKVLFWHQRYYRAYGLNEIWCDTQRQYAEGEFYFDTGKALKTEKWFADKLSALSDYDYDVLPLSFYDDREIPTTMLLTVCEEMNKRWKYPVFSMEIPSAALGKVAERGGDSIPVYSGDITDQWADFATISPALTSMKRDVMRKFYDAELLAALRSAACGTPYPDKAFSDVVWKLCCFDEHCWATSSKHPQKMHRSNIEQVKRKPIEEAHAFLVEQLDRLCGTPATEALSIINTIPRKRNSGLRLNEGMPIPAGISHQILPDGSTVTAPICFDGIQSKRFPAAHPVSDSVLIYADRIETDHYSVRFHTNTQKLLSIVDKESGHELLDLNARFEFGQFIYTYSEDKLQPASGFEVPKKLTFELYDGELAYVLVQKGYEEQSGAETSAQIIFYKHEKNIDIDLSFKNALGLIGDYYDRYKKNYFFALPFALSSPAFFTELQAGEKNEETDVLPHNARDFTVTQNWIAAEENGFGIAVHSTDMPVFHLGRIKYNCFEKECREEHGHFYLYASSNRSNNLIYTAPEQCCAGYRLSVLPYTGSHKTVIPVWSNEKEHALLPGTAVLPDSGAITVDRKNARLVALKKAETDGNALILRFVETEGCAADCTLRLFFEPEKAMYTTADERELAPIECCGRTVPFRLSPYSYTTLKICGSFPVCKE